MPNLVGFGITLPHKQTAIDLCDSLDPVAARVGAVNLVRRERDGSFQGYQFDGRGFVRGLQSQRIAIDNRDVLVVGTGGAAVAIAFALVEAGVRSITVSNRTMGKAEALAETVNADFGRQVVKAGTATPQAGQLVINATSLGLQNADALPINPETVRPGMTVAEVIAQPEITYLLSLARERGAQIHSGIHRRAPLRRGQWLGAAASGAGVVGSTGVLSAALAAPEPQRDDTGAQIRIAPTWAGAARLSGPMGAAACTHDVSGHGRARGSLAVMRRMPPQQGQTVGSKRAR